MRSQVQVMAFNMIDVVRITDMLIRRYQCLVNIQLISLYPSYTGADGRIYHHPQGSFAAFTHNKINYLFCLAA
jgi:hypothetical protein